MQNFGLASLLRRGSDTPDGRIRRALLWVGLTALGMGLAYQFQDYFAVAALATIGFNFTHWVTDIELSRRTSRWGWGFLAIVLLFGIAWLLLRQGPLSVQSFPQIIRVRDGLGMVHFIYSARIWKRDAALALISAGERPGCVRSVGANL
jgi:predicted PurR-regulated permease PerM